jgi:choline dehydrogenase-like flavoprotein
VHATATHLDTDASGRHLKSVEIADPEGKRSTVRARAVVLCAGGVENARILLYSNRILPNGVGNTNDVVGRYFMDHPRDPDLTVRFNTSDADRVRAFFGPYRLDGARHRNSFVHGFALSYEMQRRHGLLNCTAWPFEIISADDPILAAKRLAAGPKRAIRDIGLVVSQPGVVLRALHARLIAGQRARPRIDRIGFLVGSEQSPDPDSRIRLSERRDRLGLPLSRINWRIGAQERASQAMLAQLIATEFQRMGLPRAHLAEWVTSNRHEDAVLVDGCHPIGTTRMSSDPRYGVVDAECQVHGVEGLYVAGSSIFPTGGHANPTLMIVAFAVRRSHH